jgi:predicted secreted protein
MWEQMTGDTADMSWLAAALSSGTVIMGADGSYNKNKSTLISGARWIIRCLSSGKWQINPRIGVQEINVCRLI